MIKLQPVSKKIKRTFVKYAQTKRRKPKYWNKTPSFGRGSSISDQLQGDHIKLNWVNIFACITEDRKTIALAFIYTLYFNDNSGVLKHYQKMTYFCSFANL